MGFDLFSAAYRLESISSESSPSQTSEADSDEYPPPNYTGMFKLKIFGLKWA